MPAFQAHNDPRPTGSSRSNSVSSSLGEFVPPPRSSTDAPSSLIEGNYPAHNWRSDTRKQQKHHIQRDLQEDNMDFDGTYYDPQSSFAQSDPSNDLINHIGPDIFAIQKAEDDLESIFAFRPPPTAELRGETKRMTQVAAAIAPHNRNGSTNHYLSSYRFQSDSQDLRTLVNYPASPPRAVFDKLSHSHDISPLSRSLSGSFRQSAQLRTLNETVDSYGQSSWSTPCCSSATPDAHGTQCRTCSEGHNSYQDNSTRRGKVMQAQWGSLNDNDKDEDDDRTRNSVVSFEFETDSLNEPSLKGHQWSYDEPVDDSPYPEVRASVSNTDDVDIPVLTLRMWFIGLTLCSLSAGLNTFFSFRFPAPSIAPLVLILISHPFGKFAAFILPTSVFHFPSWFSRLCGMNKFSFNPGPWNIKEHACIYIMANASIVPAYAMNTVVVAEQFYRVKLGIGFNLTLVLATQLIGFGLAGLARPFLVWPASMIWPSNLVVCTLLNTLHADEDVYSPTISRYKFFTIATCAAFFYYFLPGFLFQALSAFSYICWIAPDNIIINQLFGVRSGLGMGVLTFDWSMISFIGSPLMIPWWAQVHTIFGFIIFFWILAPILYYTNVWNLSRFPMASNIPFDITGHQYNISRVVTPNHMLNVDAYAHYSPLYLPVTYTIAYLITFALSTCILTHTILYYGKSVLDNIRNVKTEEEDVHARLMKGYPEVPNWWYAACFLVFFAIGIVSIRAWPTGMPVWALTLCLILCTIYLLPSGFIYATTGQTISLNLLGEIIPGVLFPENPLVNMAYSVQSLGGALGFVQALKLGHYIKTPPRAAFLVQVISTILTSFVQVLVKEWMFNNIPDICSPSQKDLLTCPGNEVFYTASVIWGLIGPGRQLGRGSIYRHEVYALIIGLLAPVPLWYWHRRYPKSWLPHISLPVILNGPLFIPPANGINYSSWFAVGFFFQYIIRTRHFSWWSKFNYVLSAALDSGTVLSICAVFFFLQVPHGGFTLNWVGNTVFTKTADWNSTSLIPPS